jgi:hypothetical protein
VKILTDLQSLITLFSKVIHLFTDHITITKFFLKRISYYIIEDFFSQIEPIIVHCHNKKVYNWSF